MCLCPKQRHFPEKLQDSKGKNTGQRHSALKSTPIHCCLFYQVLSPLCHGVTETKIQILLMGTSSLSPKELDVLGSLG